MKSKTLTEEAFTYMSLLIVEDCPKNSKELLYLIGDFLSDGMAYSFDLKSHLDSDAVKLCQLMQKIFIEKQLINVE